MKNHASTVALGTAVALGMLLTGCSGTEAPSPAASDPSASTSDSPQSEPSSSPHSGGTAISDGAGVSIDEIRDGTWQIADAGEVEFTAEGGSLSLTEVRPSDGWQQRVTDEKPDEIEVHFTQGDQEWKFEVESERGTVQISKELTIRNGGSGDFQIGSTATLTLVVDGSTISVSDITPASGWSTVKQDESPDDVELDFRNDSTGGTAEFEAEAGSTGVKIEISQKLRGTAG